MFSKLDLVKGYYQVNMNPADIPKMAIITPFGLWEFVVMPFGLSNAGNTFQRMMDRVGAGLDFVFIYLDDILIASSDMEEHLVHLQQVFERLREIGSTLPSAPLASNPSIFWATPFQPLALPLSRTTWTPFRLSLPPPTASSSSSSLGW